MTDQLCSHNHLHSGTIPPATPLESSPLHAEATYPSGCSQPKTGKVCDSCKPIIQVCYSFNGRLCLEDSLLSWLKLSQGCVVMFPTLPRSLPSQFSFYRCPASTPLWSLSLPTSVLCSLYPLQWFSQHSSWLSTHLSACLLKNLNWHTITASTHPCATPRTSGQCSPWSLTQVPDTL